MTKLCTASWILFVALSCGLPAAAKPSAALEQPSGPEEKSIARKFQAAEPEYEKARMAFARKDIALAGKKAEACLRHFPEHADAAYLAALVAYGEGRLEEALELMAAAERHYALTASLRLKYRSRQASSLHSRKKQIEADIAAIQDFLADTTLQLSPRDAADYQKQLDIKNQQLAVINSRLIGPVEPGSEPPADYAFLQGNILFKLKRFDEAEGRYLAALASAPGHEQALNNLASLLFTLRRFEDALARIEQAEALGLKVNAQLKKAVREALGL